jgi:hypothetical protein
MFTGQRPASQADGVGGGMLPARLRLRKRNRGSVPCPQGQSAVEQTDLQDGIPTVWCDEIPLVFWWWCGGCEFTSNAREPEILTKVCPT